MYHMYLTCKYNKIFIMCFIILYTKMLIVSIPTYIHAIPPAAQLVNRICTYKVLSYLQLIVSRIALHQRDKCTVIVPLLTMSLYHQCCLDSYLVCIYLRQLCKHDSTIIIIFANYYAREIVRVDNVEDVSAQGVAEASSRCTG